MERIRTPLGTFGAGAALLSLLVAATCLWNAEAFGSWLLGEDSSARARRNWLAAARRARLSPDYLDACRAAGL